MAIIALSTCYAAEVSQKYFDNPSLNFAALKKAADRFDRGQKKPAIAAMQKLVDDGDPMAMEALGKIYLTPELGEEDPEKGVLLLIKACSFWRTLLRLPTSKKLQEGLKLMEAGDVANAKKMILAEAYRGDGDAMLAMAQIHMLGNGGKKDLMEASRHAMAAMRFFRQNISEITKQAQTLDCAANMRVIKAAIEMYNIDHRDQIDSFQHTITRDDSVLFKGGYLHAPIVCPDPLCEYSGSNMAGEGNIVCTLHGPLE